MPPRWTDEQFAADRARSLTLFREERMAEPLEMYGEVYEAYRDDFDELLETTVDLSMLHELATDVLGDERLLEVVRYLAAPPISSDDLKETSDVRSLAASRLGRNVDDAQSVIETVLLGLDSRRFPWVKEFREPTRAEREAAAVSTTALLAAQRVRTLRMNTGGKSLERAVAERLIAEGYHEVAPRNIMNTDMAPGLGEFCGESMFGTRTADLVVRLPDRRIMPIECKVSNSSTNSIKRLNNDAAAKARVWLDQFGSLTAVPAAAIAGVFNVRNLRAAQEDGLTIWWGHDLDAMVEFIRGVE